MALPTGPIDRVAVGDIIEEDWGDSVAQSLNNVTEMQTWTTWSPPGGTTIDAEGAGVMSTWFTVGGSSPTDFVVPDWATDAWVTIDINGIVYSTGTTRTSYLLQLQFGTITGRNIRVTGQGGWFTATWSSRFATIEDIAGTTRNIRVNAQQLEGGSTRWRLSDQSDVAVAVTYGTPVHSYPGL